MAASESSSPESDSLDCGFGFNDAKFSDRIVTIEVLPDSDSDDSLDDCVRYRKRSRVDPLSNANCARDEVGSGIDYESSSSGVEVRTLHVNSLILASKSPFFYKLFTNGMRESQQRHITLQIQASEEDAIMDMLKFMYTNKLPRSSPTALLSVLMAADKFEVASCMRYCSRLLCNSPLTYESALLYADLLSSISVPNSVQQLRDAATKLIADHFKDFTKSVQEDVLKLPLVGFAAVVSSDSLQVSCEDDVYEFVLKWRKDGALLSKHIIQFVRFPFMSFRQLKKVISCGKIASEVAYKLVLDALFFKAEASHGLQQQLLEKANDSLHQFVERPYIDKPVVVCQLDQKYCMEFKREECARMYPSGQINSQTFHLGEQGFVLSGCCYMDPQVRSHCFGISLCMQGKDTVGCAINYKIVVRRHPESVVCYKLNEVFIGGQVKGKYLGCTWSQFMSEKSPYFTNGVLQIRVELSSNRPTPL